MIYFFHNLRKKIICDNRKIFSIIYCLIHSEKNLGVKKWIMKMESIAGPPPGLWEKKVCADRMKSASLCHCFAGTATATASASATVSVSVTAYALANSACSDWDWLGMEFQAKWSTWLRPTEFLPCLYVYTVKNLFLGAHIFCGTLPLRNFFFFYFHLSFLLHLDSPFLFNAWLFLQFFGLSMRACVSACIVSCAAYILINTYNMHAHTHSHICSSVYKLKTKLAEWLEWGEAMVEMEQNGT